jgi:hypothetical protein
VKYKAIKTYSWHYGLESGYGFKTEMEAMKACWDKFPKAMPRISERWEKVDVPETEQEANDDRD